jgi:hypothetical protein
MNPGDGLRVSSQNAVTLAVIMERKRVASKWADYRWEAVGVVPDPPDAEAGPRRIGEEALERWLFPGLVLRLFGDEAENYQLNIGAPQPCVFVMWRLEEELARPQMVTVSYGEAARMMDSDEQVDGVPLPADLFGWIEDFARSHYRPPEKKQKGRRYASSKSVAE